MKKYVFPQDFDSVDFEKKQEQFYKILDFSNSKELEKYHLNTYLKMEDIDLC